VLCNKLFYFCFILPRVSESAKLLIGREHAQLNGAGNSLVLDDKNHFVLNFLGSMKNDFPSLKPYAAY
jgi:hypothetical protein